MTGVRDILVAYDGHDAARAALTTGLALAGRTGAHLTGCFPYDPPEILPTSERWMTRGLTSEFRTIAARMETAAREAVEQSFRAITGPFADQERIHWLRLGGNSDLAITKAARHFDLTVIGKGTRAAEAPGTSLIHPDVVALRSGKPVLIVPEGYGGLPEVPRVVIGWDGKRAAARTIGAALHLLGGFGATTVLTVGTVDEKAAFWLDLLATHLERHGVEPAIVSRPAEASIARTIIDTCGELSADLLVMGAYEHSKFSEDFLGGTTNDVLREIPLPVLMAH